MFCSDYEVGANAALQPHDQGADIYEMTSKWIERFDNSPTSSRTSAATALCTRRRLGLPSGKFGRYLGNIPNVYQQWLFNIYWWPERPTRSRQEQMDQYFGVGDPIYQNYWTMAVIDSTNLLMQQLVDAVGRLPRQDHRRRPGSTCPRTG